MVTSFTVTGASRLLIAVVLVWLLIIFVITGPLFRWSSGRGHDDTSSSDANNGEMILARLSRANSELNALKAQNEELRVLLQNYLPADVKLTHATDQSHNKIHEPSQEYELARRRIVSNVNELWHYLRTNTNTSIMNYINELRHNLMFDLETIENRDKDWRYSELKQLSNYVQTKIKALQNPEKGSCVTAKKLICQLNKGCGFGCQIHHLAYCMVIAMASERTLIMNSHNWRYAHSKSSNSRVEGWNTVFLPLSDTCLDESGSSRGSWGPQQQIDSVQVVDLPIVDSLRPRPSYLPLAIPQQIASKLITLHGSPIVWFIGQIVNYIMRPSEEMMKYINEQKVKFNFNRPIIGIHVRRTDKIGTEAAFHPLSEYMNFVDDYYNQLDLFNQRNQKIEKVKRLVYLATDDPSIWKKEVKPYEDRGYTFIGDSQIAKTASIGRRYSVDSLRNIILDIWLLSECDFLVCTFSSQVCRLAYELMQARGSDSKTDTVDWSALFHSLDDIYYFGGQSDHNQIAILSHNARSDKEINLKIGDTIGIAGNHWNGFSKGLNRINQQNGLYPGFKTIDKIDTAPFKIFDDE